MPSAGGRKGAGQCQLHLPSTVCKAARGAHDWAVALAQAELPWRWVRWVSVRPGGAVRGQQEEYAWAGHLLLGDLGAMPPGTRRNATRRGSTLLVKMGMGGWWGTGHPQATVHQSLATTLMSSVYIALLLHLVCSVVVV